MEVARKGDGVIDLTEDLLFITVHDQTLVLEDNAIETIKLNLAQLLMAYKDVSSNLSASVTPKNKQIPLPSDVAQ